MLCALIMAGGKGTRFWPLSTEEKPKQFLKLINEKTMIQTTVDRIKTIIPIERIFICTSKKYLKLIKEQLPDIPLRNVILEPESRNTAPCITLASLVIKRHFKDANMIVLPADHLISDENEFRRIVNDADKFIKKNNRAIITLGMKVTRAETGYGYIKTGNSSCELNNHKVIKVEKFVEKPDEETAKKYMGDKGYLWNGGIFVWNINSLIENIKKYLSNTYELLQCVETIKPDILERFIEERYKYTENISIDYALLEKSQDVYVIPSNFGWDDVGTWKSVERYREKDEDNNIINSNVRVIESKSNMAISNTKRVVMIGIKDIMTVETEESIFIVNKDYMDNLKDYKNII